ncbi:MAG: decaprenyl-phosphate phosphoribosyltransferase [Firmicutes bacterium]|nr:decaprenyl-phosphate phosphoribosyltransferase [Bacillota bacterium]
MDIRLDIAHISAGQKNSRIGLFISQLKLVLTLIRIRHWIKNLFIFAPLLFSQNLFNASMLAKSVLAFISFSFVASSVYALNDIFDYKKDRLHPIKRLRPIALGKLKTSFAILVAILFLTMGLVIANFVNLAFIISIAIYLGLNVLYSLYLKDQVILDVLVLSLFYVIRVSAGGFAIEVHISNWLLICTFMLAIFMGFGKRRYELTILKEEAPSHRKILAEYSPYFLDQMVAVVTPTTLIAYLLYTISEETVEKFGTDKLIATVPFVLYGVFRYLYLVHQREEGGDPTKLMLTDKPLIITVVGWVLSVVFILYFR